MGKKKLVLEIDRSERVLFRFKIQGSGGFSRASKITGIGYWRLSRILNGWLEPTREEYHLLKDYIARETSDDAIEKRAREMVRSEESFASVKAPISIKRGRNENKS
jgi:hypothetical protein